MKYRVRHDNRDYVMKPYTFDVADKIEEIEDFCKTDTSLKIKCQRIYDFIREIIGDENTQKTLGDFENADPNDINLLYLKIVEAYNKPQEDYHNKLTQEKLQKLNGLGDLTKIVDSLPAIQSLMNND